MSDQWTVETLKEYVEAKFDGIREAISKAERQSELRETKNNEFRGQLADQASRFPSRIEVEARFSALEDKIATKNVQVVLSLGVGFVAVLVAVFNFASAHG